MFASLGYRSLFLCLKVGAVLAARLGSIGPLGAGHVISFGQ
jgi:hypothetical protein